MLRHPPVLVLIVLFGAVCTGSQSGTLTTGGHEKAMINLPAPTLTSNFSIESAIKARRSIRSFSPQPVSLADTTQLLWAAQGITGATGGYRAAPSAGALYPLEIYMVAGSVTSLDPAVYRYEPAAHGLALVKAGDHRPALAGAALNQQSIATAPATLVIAAVYQRTAAKYTNRAVRYVHIEAGHAGQNILLQGVARGLGTVVIGAFDDQAVKQVLALPDDHEPISIIPTGFPLAPSPFR